MTLQIADLLAIAGIIAFPVLPFVVAGALALLKSDIRDLRTETRADIEGLRSEVRAEVRALDAKVDALTQAVRASALTRDPLATTPESGASPTMTERQPTPAG